MSDAYRLLGIFIFYFLFGDLYSGYESSNFRKSGSILTHYEPVFQRIKTIEYDSQGRFRLAKLHFRAFDKDFNLVIKPRSSTLSKIDSINLSRENGDKSNESKIHLFESEKTFITGKLSSDQSSVIHGSFYREIFIGVIFCQSETYFVERAYPFRLPFQTVIYQHLNFGSQTIKEDPLLENIDFSQSSKRQKREKFNSDHLLVCRLKLVADHTYFQNFVHRDIGDIITEMVLLIDEANIIFENTMFHLEGEQKIGLQPVDVAIFDDKNQIGYKLASESLDFKDLYLKFSEYDFSPYCLAVAFISRSFPGEEIVSLSARASATDEQHEGGICARRFHNIDCFRNFNTVMINVRMKTGQFLPRSILGRILAYEIGNAFGVQHNEPVGVTEFLKIWGDLSPKVKFSEKSVQGMALVIKNRPDCLKSKESLCGNMIVEGDEECDCGDIADKCEMVDKCCNPNGIENKACKLKDGYVCSPKNGQCCSDDCEFLSSETNMNCNNGNDCYYSSTCTGRSKDCPMPVIRRNGDPCEQWTGECYEGNCRDSLCARLNKSRCRCNDIQAQCFVCCQNEEGRCVRASAMGASYQDIPLPNGKPCSDSLGFCVNGVCQLKMSPQTSGSKKKEENNNNTPYFRELLIVSVTAILIFLSGVFYFFLWFCCKVNVIVDKCWFGGISPISSEEQTNIKNPI